MLAVEAEARQEAFVAIQQSLKTEREYWRRELERLRSWMAESLAAGANAEFIIEGALRQLISGTTIRKCGIKDSELSRTLSPRGSAPDLGSPVKRPDSPVSIQHRSDWR